MKRAEIERLLSGADSPYDLSLDIASGQRIETGDLEHPDLEFDAVEVLPLKRMLLHRLRCRALGGDGTARAVDVVRVVGVLNSGEEVEVLRRASVADDDPGDHVCAACGRELPADRGAIREVDGLVYHEGCIEEDEDA